PNPVANFRNASRRVSGGKTDRCSIETSSNSRNKTLPRSTTPARIVATESFCPRGTRESLRPADLHRSRQRLVHAAGAGSPARTRQSGFLASPTQRSRTDWRLFSETPNRAGLPQDWVAVETI